MSRTYAQKLKNPKWQRKRLEILERDGFKCKLCCDAETELHIHHTYYEKGKEPHEYDKNSLETLCSHCHCVVEYFKEYLPLFKITKITKRSCGILMTLFVCALDTNLNQPILKIIHFDTEECEVYESETITQEIIASIYNDLLELLKNNHNG
jgi:hypothetical protein